MFVVSDTFENLIFEMFFVQKDQCNDIDLGGAEYQEYCWHYFFKKLWFGTAKITYYKFMFASSIMGRWDKYKRT